MCDEATNLRVRLQHLLGVLAGSICQFRATEHAGNFFGAFFAGDGTDSGAGASGDLLLFNYIMVISKCRDLRQMGHAEDLIGSRELVEFSAYGLADAASTLALSASITRESSPPDAICSNGRSGSPGLVEIKYRT